MAKVDFKLTPAGVDVLMGQIDKAIRQFNRAQKTLNSELYAIENSLTGLSKSVFINKVDTLKEGINNQDNILTDVRTVGLAAKEMFQESDAQIATRICG
jgi:uncharacterized protein YukE